MLQFLAALLLLISQVATARGISIAGTTVAGDLTGNGHYGTLSAGVTAGAAGPPTGDGDTAMAFHGADAVTVASMGGLPSGAHPYSLEAWVLPSAGGAAAQGLVGYGNYAATRQAAYLRLAGATGLLHSWRNDDLTATQTAVLTGTWHLATASYDGHSRRLYLDGVPFAADAPASQPNVQLANLALGQTNGTERLVGSLANVAIYPYALTPAQVGRHYALGEHSPAPTPTTSVLQYSYDGAGRLNSIVYPDGGRENHSDYDPAGRVTHISLPDGTDYYLSYNAAGQRTQLAYPNGGAQLWAYDAAGRPHDTWWQGPGNTVPFTQTATLDAAGQRTVLQDTAGTTTYGYDGAGRLTGASYPDGSTEADQYDPLGDRTVITSTTVLSGTAVTTNSFDAAAQLSTSVAAGGAQPGTTTYTYDGNGAQTGSAGPAGATTNTFNQQGQLTHVSGPATNETFVYDGQGDRLRAYDQGSSNYQLHTLVQDLRPGGMSGLLSDGAADYGYADFGVGAAPVARMDAGSSQGAYLATDLLGSVRLATNPSDQTLGSGTYDAWGNARPTTADAAGQVLLAGLQASAPFGYAGQQYDAGPATYSMRARQYDPAQGRLQSVDPQAPSDGYPVTLNPYQYAGDMVTGTTDPSGRGWVYQQPRSADYVEEAAIAYDTLPGTSFGFVGGGPFLEFHVPVSPDGVHCSRGSSIYTINVLQRSTGEIWDIEHVQAYRRSASSIRTGVDGHLIGGARTFGVLNQTYAGIPGMPGHGCTRFDEMGCRDPSAAGPQRLSNAHGGERYPQAFGLLPSHLGGASGADVRVIPIVARQEVLAAWQADSGVIVYDTFPAHFPEQRLCPANYNAKQCLFDILVVQDVNTATNTHANLLARGLAVFNISTNLMLGAGLVIKGIRLATKAATATGDLLARLSAGTALVAIQDAGGSVRLATDIEEASLARAAEEQGGRSLLGDCGCFPGGTGVATPHGLQAIASLHVGDAVLAEDPLTGRVEPEPVLAVIDDGIKPTMRVGLSDGSSLQVTTNHPFYVDGGPGIDAPRWVQAGDLRVGDQLRTEDGRDITIAALQYHTGYAHVYTLTVAKDHTFFVGTSGVPVLVHNCGSGDHEYFLNNRFGSKIGKPAHVPTNGGRFESHHLLQDGWAKQNLHSVPSYTRNDAPTAYIVTGSGKPHTLITNLQNAREAARVAAGGGAWSSTLDEELRYIVSDWTTVGFDSFTIRRVIAEEARYLRQLGAHFTTPVVP